MQPQPSPSRLDRYFKITARGSSVRTEVLGGLTTFLTMAYIIVVNPGILAEIGIPKGPCTVATILTATFGCLLMGLYANLPIAVAPYMGENAFLAFGLVALSGAIGEITWQQRLGSVFISGILFLVISVLRIRSWLAEAVSPSMKHSFAVGIGLFLAFIGLYQSGIVTSLSTGLPRDLAKVDSNGLLLPLDVPVKIGNLRDPAVLLAVISFLVMAILAARGIRGSVLIGIVCAGSLGFASGVTPFELPDRFILPFTGDYSLDLVLGQLEVMSLLRWAFLPMLLTLFLMSFLDTLGTLVAVGTEAGLTDEAGNLPQIERPMIVDALACTVGPLLGTSTSGAYIESAAGIKEGARTGLAAVVTGCLFALSLLALPLITPFQRMGYAYWPALVVVGMLMLGSIQKLKFDDLTEVVPAFVTIVMMVFTFNIANGLTAGLLIYPLIKLAAGRWREIRPGSVVLALMCAGYYGFGVLH